MPFRTISACIFVVLLQFELPSFAQSGDTRSGIMGASVRIDGCDDEIRSTMTSSLRLELDDQGPSVQRWLEDATPSLVLSCTESGATLRAELPSDGQTLSRSFSLEEAESRGFGRLAAFSSLELLDALREVQERSAAPSPEEETAPVSPQTESDVPVEPPTDEPRRLTISVHGDVWYGGQPGWVQGGGRVGVAFSPIRWVAIELDLHIAGGRTSVSLGQVGTTFFSSSLRVLACVPTERFSFRGGLGYRLGLIRWKGEPSDSSHVGLTPVGGWSGPVAIVQGQVHFGRFSFDIRVEGGYVVKPARALIGSSPELALSGFWLSVGLGFSVWI